MSQQTPQHRVERVVFNDRLGYAVIYYKPIGKGGVKVPKLEDICDQRRHKILNPYNDKVDEKFCEEVEAMVRKRERETATKEIESICEKISDLFREVEQQDIKHRDILNYRVREQIKGKSAQEICDILVQDVLNHTKPNRYYHKEDVFPHKMKYKILAAGIQRAPASTRRPSGRYFETSDDAKARELETQNVLKRVEDYLANHSSSNIHELKYKHAMDRIHDEIVLMKRRCCEKLEFL